MVTPGREELVERGVRALWLGLAAYVLVSYAFQRAVPSVPFHRLVPVIALACAGVALWLLRRPLASSASGLARWTEAGSTTTWLAACLTLGAVARVAVWLLFPVETLTSDPAAYWGLAERLAADGQYRIGDTRSYWPPGYPLFLFPAVAVLGPQPWVAPLLNVLLFGATTLVVFRLARKLFGEGPARFSAAVLALWPNLVLAAGAPHKELLAAFLLPSAILLYVQAGRRPWLGLVGSGLCLGFAALTQPSTLLFGVVFVGYEWAARARPGQAMVRLAIAALVAGLTVMPWTVRNWAAHGMFIPINTAGGINFYSANNPNATGGWIPDNLYIDQRLGQADEVEANRLGYAYATRWITENKAEFLKLMVMKQTRFLCCSDFGAFYIFDNPRTASDESRRAGRIATAISDGYWLLLWVFVVVGALGLRRMPARALPIYLVLSLSVLYFLAIHSVFQSEAKHNINLAGVLAVMACTALLRGRNPQRLTGPGE